MFSSIGGVHGQVELGPQLVVADRAVAAVCPHPFSSLTPVVAQGRQGSIPDRLGVLVICRDSL